jgi:D-erythronate 2-dehydrogenase
MDELVRALALRFGESNASGVTYQCDAAIESAFGRYPALDDRAVRSMGFVDDGSVDQLILNALECEPLSRHPALETT